MGAEYMGVHKTGKMKLFNIVLATASAMGMGKLPQPQAMAVVEPEVQVARSCEWAYQGNDNKVIRCESDEVLEIIDAWYGRETSSICNVERGGGRLYNTPGACRADAKSVIVDRCDGRRRCNLAFGNSFVGDPCYGTTKYLEVTYQCNKIAVPEDAPEIHIDEPKKMM